MSTGAVNRFILYSDIAGSSRLADAYPREYSALLDQHNALVLHAVSTHGGQVYKNLGDGYIALFETARACADCAVMLQCGLGELPPLGGSGGVQPPSGEGQGPRAEGQGEESVGRAAVPATTTERLLVRLALHGGELRQSDGEYFGPALNRASRICQVISAGQVVASGTVIGLLGGAGAPPADFATGEGARATAPTITDMGEHHLRDLAEPEHLYQLDHPGFALHDFPPLATLNNRPNNLVEQPNRFIGRVKELAELEALLAGARSDSGADGTVPHSSGGAGVPAGQRPMRSEALPDAGREARATGDVVRATNTTRLLTVIAPGGYGKSRIAAQVCANLLPQFERGCFMVYLAPVRDVIDVPTAIGGALGYQFSAGRTPEQQLCDYLRSKELLLCLDNMEHLLECASLIADILKAAPKVKVVITSREPLRIQGEHIYRLEPLPVHAAESQGYSEAVRLFADRAILVNSSLAVDSSNLQVVEQICERLSGIPLAIELAAAWMDGFTLSELLEELDQQLEIEARSSDVEARHQSLKACLDWSWNLLGPEQQEMLMRLSVFRGGFFAEAAGSVLGMKGMALRSALLKLCDKSWLYTREVDSQTRFFLRDMLAHEYALAKLEGSRQKDGRQEDSGSGGVRPPSGSASVPLASEKQSAVSIQQDKSGAGVAARHPDAPRDGRATGVRGDAGEGARATEEISLYESAVCAHAAYFAKLAEREGPRLRGGGTPDGGLAQIQALSTWRIELENINEALDSAQHRGNADWLLPIARHLYRYLGVASSFSNQQARYSQLLATAEALGRLDFIVEAKVGLAAAHMRLGQNREAFSLYSSSLALARESGDRQREADSLSNQAKVLTYIGDYAHGLDVAVQALALYRRIGDRLGEAHSLSSLAAVKYMKAEFAKCAELESQGLAISREMGDRQGEARSTVLLANVHFKQGALAKAEELYGQGLATFREIGDRGWGACCLGSLASVRFAQGDSAQALELQSQALTIFREIGDRSGEASILGNQALVLCELGDYAQAEGRLIQALAIFRELGEPYGEALALANLARFRRALGDLPMAADLHSQALRLFREIGSEQGTCLCCATTAATLTALQALRLAAVTLYGGQAQAVARAIQCDAVEQKQLDEARAHLDSAVASGEITAEQLSAWQAEGEAMSLDELADFVQAALAEVATNSPEVACMGADLSSAAPIVIELPGA